MNAQRPIGIIPALYIFVLVFVNVLAVVLFQTLDIANQDLLLIRVGSITNLVFYGSLFVLYLVLYIPAWKRTAAHFNTWFSRMLVLIVFGIALMFIMMFLMGILYYFLDVVEEPDNQVILEMQLTGPLFDRITLIVFAVLFAPFVEEVVFRLATFRLLKRIKRIPIWLVIAISSLLFGFIHVVSDDIIQILYYAGLGVVLGYIYHKSNNILVPVVVHMVFNAFVTATMFIGI